MAADGGHDDAVAALAQAVGELALLEGDAAGAHVRNLLGKLDCRSRVEASHRAGELGLLS